MKFLKESKNVIVAVRFVHTGGGLNVKNDIKNVQKDFNLTGSWISGFSQSDGCFTITFEKYKTGLYVRPRPIFFLGQDYSEEGLFKSLLKYLGAG